MGVWSVEEVPNRLGFYVLSAGKQLPTFPKSIVLPTSRSSNPRRFGLYGWADKRFYVPPTCRELITSRQDLTCQKSWTSKNKELWPLNCDLPFLAKYTFGRPVLPDFEKNILPQYLGSKIAASKLRVGKWFWVRAIWTGEHAVVKVLCCSSTTWKKNPTRFDLNVQAVASAQTPQTQPTFICCQFPQTRLKWY